MTTDDDNDPIGFVRDVVAKVCWDLAYHEAELPKAYQKLALARELFKRCGITADPESIEADGYDEETDLKTYGNVEQLAAAFVHEHSDTVTYHERAIKRAQSGVAMAKIMLMRGKYSEIDFREIERQQRERAEKSVEEDDD